MKATTMQWRPHLGWQPALSADHAASIVLYFSAPSLMNDGRRFTELRAAYPNARILGCTSGGEILGDEALDGAVVATVVEFAKTTIGAAEVDIAVGGNSFAAGIDLGNALAHPDLKAVFILSDGTRVNGSELIRGIQSSVGDQVIITGGLAGDGADFKETLVGLDHNPLPGKVAAFGFTGPAIKIGHGSIGGWDGFGPARTITRSEGNVLFELDGQPVLPLYKKYLGDEAAKLPSSALLFPLTVHSPNENNSEVVRTVLAVDEANNSMTFAGDVPTGWTAQLMRGNFDRLVAGAEQAAEMARQSTTSLSILISCIGRKLLLGQRIGDEVEAAYTILNPSKLVGFYSYGEISPHQATKRCELHNQTMTITTFAEI